MASPKCKGCEERHPNCHSDCKDYKAFREKIDEQNKKRHMAVTLICYQVDEMRKNKSVMMRKKSFRRQIKNK